MISGLLSCSADNSEFYHGALDAGRPKIIVASQGAGSMALVMYDENGTLLRVLKDYVPDNLVPRGVTAVDSFNFLVATDAGIGLGEKIDTFNLYEGERPFVNATMFSGNIFQIRRHPSFGTFALVDNAVFAFDDQGQNSGLPRVPTVVGGCTLNGPTSLTFNQNNNLVVISPGNDTVNVYDVADPVNTTCVTSNATFAGLGPTAVLAHSNGLLYVATQGDDRIYVIAGDGTGVPVVVFDNIGFIEDPTALAEMPDGTILVASDATDTVVQINADGSLVGLSYFFSDTFTGSISDIMVLQEAE